MRNNGYIPAFTMMDILTGMVVMSIVIVMVFYLMSATNQQAFGYQKIRLELNNYLLLKADLKRQVEAADRMVDSPDGFRLIAPDSEIRYRQQDTYLLRQTAHSLDTLSNELLLLKKILCDSVQTSNQPGLLSGVELHLAFETQVLTCFLYKDYGLTEPMNQKLLREF